MVQKYLKNLKFIYSLISDAIINEIKLPMRP